MRYVKNVSEPWFSLIKIGKKRCEGRLNKGDFQKMEKGDMIEFENEEMGFKRQYTVKITDITHYTSFRKYLKGETLRRTLPGIDSLKDGERVYYRYYSVEDEKKYGIVAIKMKVI